MVNYTNPILNIPTHLLEANQWAYEERIRREDVETMEF